MFFGQFWKKFSPATVCWTGFQSSKRKICPKFEICGKFWYFFDQICPKLQLFQKIIRICLKIIKKGPKMDQKIDKIWWFFQILKIKKLDEILWLLELDFGARFSSKIGFWSLILDLDFVIQKSYFLELDFGISQAPKIPDFHDIFGSQKISKIKVDFSFVECNRLFCKKI